MDGKRVNLITTFLGAVGVLLILAMAFGLVEGRENIFLFAGIACLIIAGALKKALK